MHNRKHQSMENFRNLVFRGMICSDLDYMINFQGITQTYQCKPSNEA